MSVRRFMLVTFLLTDAIAGYAYWIAADWWAYVMDPVRGPWPKFRLTLPEQIIISAVAGLRYALPVTLGVYVVWRLWTWRRA